MLRVPYRNITRIRHVVNVLVRHGFGHLIQRTPLYRHLPRRKAVAVEKEELLRPEQRIRMALEELGPTYVKLGQLLSTRQDLVPPTVIQELQSLQDRVPPFPSSEARRIIAEEMGRPVEESFSSFENEPVAAASIAQVHYATLHDGAAVAVKVRRPGIEKDVEADISILFTVAHLLERHVPESRIYDPVGIVREFALSIRREMDFTLESGMVDRFRRAFEEDETVRIPKVYWELTGKRTLTMERIDGVKMAELDTMKAEGLNLKEISERLIRIFLKQYFELGFFHADPHPGNILILPDERIALLDFGNVGCLDEELKESLATILIALVQRNLDRLVEEYLELGIAPEEVNLRQLKNDSRIFLDRYYGRPLKEIELGQVFMEVVELARRHRIRLPRDFILLGRSLLTLEALARELDPEADFVGMAKPYAARLLARRFSPAYLSRGLSATAVATYRLLRDLPRNLAVILKKASHGKFKLEFEHRGLDRLIFEMDRSTNRLAFSILIAALVIASSLLVHAGLPPKLLGLPLPGLLGYLFAGILAAGLAIAILRSGKI